MGAAAPGAAGRQGERHRARRRADRGHHRAQAGRGAPAPAGPLRHADRAAEPGPVDAPSAGEPGRGRRTPGPARRSSSATWIGSSWSTTAMVTRSAMPTSARSAAGSASASGTATSSAGSAATSSSSSCTPCGQPAETDVAGRARHRRRPSPAATRRPELHPVRLDRHRVRRRGRPRRPMSCSRRPTRRCTAPSSRSEAPGRSTTPRCGTRPRALLQLRSDVKDALEEDQFVLHYQPIVRLADASSRRPRGACCAGSIPPGAC